MAPSPTGLLHFGTARTSLINWLFARHHQGVFVLRIEDTDTERSKKEFEDDLIGGLKWLGIDWDEGPDKSGSYGPYRQSERLDLYERYLKKMLDQAQAYFCYCTKEELELERQAMMDKGGAPRYSGRCRTAPPEGREPRVIRLKTPEKKITFNDIIRGEITFDLALAGDMVIAKDLRNPLYNFAVVIDDYEMKISHVIRGEDHIANTPKQIVLQEILGLAQPQYAHLPIILNPDRSKMSKRFTETSILKYRDMGYLSDALVNFIAFLGWHPEDDDEMLSRQDLIEQFTLERMQKAGAVFDEKKLNWLNSQYIKNLPNDTLADLVRPFIKKANLKMPDKILKKLVDLEKNRAETLTGLINDSSFFFQAGDYDAEILIWKNSTSSKAKEYLEQAYAILEKIGAQSFTQVNLQESLMSAANVVGRGDFLWPLRVALSCKTASPGPFEIAYVLGKEETLKRIQSAINKL